MKTGRVLFLTATASVLFGCSSDDKERIGLADPNFGLIAEAWDAHTYSLAMDDIWTNGAGIGRRGTNYYLLPKAVAAGAGSERFNPSSRYFQSWLGVYTVKDDATGVYASTGGRLDAAAIVNLSLADQASWLQAYGVTTSLTVSADPSTLTVDDLVVDGSKGWKITGDITSNVDVGDNNAVASMWADALGTVDSSVWAGKVSSYQIVTLPVVCYVWHAPENGELNVAYYNGVRFTDLAGASHSTLPETQSELDAMARAITVYR